MVACPKRVYAQALARVLDGLDMVSATSTSVSGAMALQLAARRAPDVLVVDASLPECASLVRTLRCQDAGPGILVIGANPMPATPPSRAGAGTAACLPESSPLGLLIETLETIEQGGPLRFVSGSAVRDLAIAGQAREDVSKVLVTLTPRETEVAAMLEHGVRNVEIAEALGIRSATVKVHVHSILRKLGVRTRGEAAALVRRAGVSTDAESER